MAHFYGKTWGRVESIGTRYGAKNSGLTTQAGSWDGGIQTELVWDEELQCNRFVVKQIQWQGSGISEVLATGVVGQPAERVYKHDIL